jgi:hypothetical protein
MNDFHDVSGGNPRQYSPKSRIGKVSLIQKTVAEIESLDNEYILKASPTELEQFYLNKVTIEPLTLHTDQYYIENRVGVKADVSGDIRRDTFGGPAFVQGTRLDIAIPFEGDLQLWRLRPSPFTFWSYPEINIRDDLIVFSYVYPDDTANAEAIKSKVDQHVTHLADVVGNLRRAVESHNQEAAAAIRAALARKRERARAALDVVSSLGIPIRRRDEPLVYVAPVQRRPSPVGRPSVPQERYRPEYFLPEAEYEHILRVMRSMSLVIERNPESFTSLDEEAIRNHFLIQLNGHYEGSATGETFNASGKTDILIRVEDRNVFIAECKFWHGQSAFNKAIDQLLGYLSWKMCTGHF